MDNKSASMKVQWNTGNRYTAQGQPIVAQYVDGKVIFQDLARGICGVAGTIVDGKVVPLTFTGSTKAELREFVTAAYSAYAYYYDADASRLAWDGAL